MLTGSWHLSIFLSSSSAVLLPSGGLIAPSLLTAAAPWFLNGLHSVPDNGPCSRDLMGKILPLVNREDADIQALAYPASHRAGMQPNPLDEDADDSGDDELDLREDALSVHSALSDDEVFVRPGNFRNAQQSNRPETLPL